VILPELVCNYGDMPIQHHDSKFNLSNSVTIKQNQWRGSSAALSILQIGGIYAKNEPNLCVFALCLLELHITLAGPPFAAFTRLAQHYSGHLHQAFSWDGRVSIEANPFGYA
jgi:hypothetical protein